MILTGSEIIKELLFGRIRIKPFNIDNVGPNSYDLTLSNKLLVYKEKVLDLKSENPVDEIVIPDTGYVLEQGKFYLGCTNEATGSSHYTPMLQGRSSIARLGLITHLSAGFGDLGWYGQWTLEMVPYVSVKIYPNMRICQVFFTKMSGLLTRYSGKYQDQTGPTASKLWMDKLQKSSSYHDIPMLVNKLVFDELLPLCKPGTSQIAYIPWDKRYVVSDMGDIISLVNKPKLLSVFFRKEPYPLVQLVETKIYVHRLIAAAFLGPAISSSGEPLVVRHKDDNPLNNKLSNLQFGTYKDNSEDAKKNGKIYVGMENHNAKLSDDMVKEIRLMRHQQKTKIKRLSQIFGVCGQTISRVLSGEAWAHINDGLGNLHRPAYKKYELTNEQKKEIDKLIIDGVERSIIAKQFKVPKRVIHHRAQKLCDHLIENKI
jgi:dCTP deaminase